MPVDTSRFCLRCRKRRKGDMEAPAEGSFCGRCQEIILAGGREECNIEECGSCGAARPFYDGHVAGCPTCGAPGYRREGQQDQSLESAREKIRQLDRKLAGLLAERREVALEAGRAKQKAGRPIRDKAREKESRERLADLAERKGYPGEDMEIVYALLATLSLKSQHEHLSDHG